RPGVILQTGTMQRVVIGEYDGKPSERTRLLHEALAKAGATAELSTDVRRAIWEKYAFLVGISATTASMRTTIGPIRKNPRTRAFLLDVFRETVAVGRAHGIALPADYADACLARAAGRRRASRRHDRLDGARPAARQPAGSRMALRRRGAAGRREGRSDTREPRRVGHPRASRGRRGRGRIARSWIIAHRARRVESI